MNKSCLINQREVHTHTKSFGAALHAALREDPDIVLCGELRDLETVPSANIRDGETHQIPGVMQTGGKLGMVQLNTALLKLVKDDKVTPEEAVNKAADKELLRSQLVRFGLMQAAPAAGSTVTEPISSGAPSGARTAASTQTQRKSRWFNQ